MALLTREQLEAEWYAQGVAAGVDMGEFSLEYRYTEWGNRYPVFVKNPEEFCYAEKDGYKCSKPLDHEGSHMKNLYWK